jgi:Uma2 family endonuclease
VNLSSLWEKDENRVLKVEYAMETDRAPKVGLSFACKSVTAIRCAKTPPLDSSCCYTRAMIATKPNPLTIAEYKNLERTSGIKHEFVDGVMVAMAGEKRIHKRIAGNIYRLLFDLGAARGCEVMLEAKVRTRSTRYRYPDLVVSCAPGDDEYFLENPCLLVEVLSESTANTDTSEKLNEYLKLESLQRYVLVDEVTLEPCRAGWSKCSIPTVRFRFRAWKPASTLSRFTPGSISQHPPNRNRPIHQPAAVHVSVIGPRAKVHFNQMICVRRTLKR